MTLTLESSKRSTNLVKPSSTFPFPGQPAILRLRRRHGSGRGYGAGPGEAAVLKGSEVDIESTGEIKV